MKKIVLLLASAMMLMPLMAQETEKKESPWKCTGLLGLNASATGLWNWAAGGNNNITGVAFGKVRLLYAENNLSWETNLDLEYGLTFVDQTYDKLQKSSDHIIFNTKFGWAFAPKWYLTVNAGFESQFAHGLTYPGDGTPNEIISKWLAPSYTDISVGIDWKPNDIFSVYISPIAGRITTACVSDKVNDKFAEQYALEDGGLRQVLQEKYGTWKYEEDKASDAFAKKFTNARAELGLTLKGAINYKYKDLTLMTSLKLFTPYAWDKTKLYDYTVDGTTTTYSEAQMESHGFDIKDAVYKGFRDNNRRFGNFDVDWDVAISYQFLKCLNVTLSTSLKYYNGVMIDKVFDKGLPTEYTHAAERVQFKGVLGLGVGYSF
ncbi:MAG: DUF3078 domain-containing protein [Paludibacteraceae bacterium]|nr:DUF3078 domain-containing protein [Paludibacteraceae bacterium]